MKDFFAFLLLAASFLSVESLGAQTFRNPYRIPTTQDPISVFAVDLNGDGLPDLLYETEADAATPSTMKTMLGQPGGGYAAGPTLVLPAYTGGCRPVDANRDGIPDLVCLFWIDNYDIEVATFPGYGDGSFQPPIYSGPMQSSPFFDFSGWIFTPADVNGDSIPDLLVGDAMDEWVFVLLGDGTGRFTVKSILGGAPVAEISGFPASAAMSITVTDINGDGKPDLIFASGPIVILGNGDGTFKAPTTYVGNYYSCVYHDMDGDGHPDAVCANVVYGDELAILHGNADGSFNTTPIYTKTYSIGELPKPVAVFDVNGDGIADILAYSSDGLEVLLGKPGLSFAAPVHYAVGYLASNGETSSQFMDVNKDGHVDVVSAGPNGIYISYGNSDGSFNAAPAIVVAQIVGRVTVADFNGDGIPDIAATGDQSVELSLGNGDGSFKPFTSLPSAGISFASDSAAMSIFHGDFDGDGKQDLLAFGTPSTYSYNSYIFYGNGDGTFSAPQNIYGSSILRPAFYQVVVADINKDGRDDIVTMDSSNMYVALSGGGNGFTTVTTALPTNSTRSTPSFPAFADFNRDGKLDAVFGLSSSITVLKGHGDGSFDATGVSPPIPDYRGKGPIYGHNALVTTGDFDGDGNTDIAALVQIDYGTGLPWTSQILTVAYVYYGNGDGTFTSPVVAGTFNRIYTGIYSAVLNQDGRSDLVLQTSGDIGFVVAPSGDALGVVMSLPERVFGPEVNYTGGQYETGLVIADLNRDGYSDLLAVNSGFFTNGNYMTMPGNSVTELLNLGAQSSAGTHATTTALTTSVNPVLAGASVVFTATVTSSTPGAGTPTGTVSFADQTGIHTSAPLVAISSSAATATLTTSKLSVGSDVISASYSGDSDFATSSTHISQTVTGYPETYTVNASPNPSFAGQAVTFNITIANTSGSVNPSPMGYISIFDGSSVIAGPYSVNYGTATAYAAITVPGMHTLTVWYSGDAAHASNSAVVSEEIQATPTVSISPSVFYITTAQALSLTVTVNGGTGNPTATGTVTLAGSGYTSPATSLSHGSVTFNVPAGALPAGNVQLTATYTPDAAGASYYTGASNSTNFVVTPFTIGGTTVSVAAGANIGNTSTITVTPSQGFTGTVRLHAQVTGYPTITQVIDEPRVSFGPSYDWTTVAVTSANAVTTSLAIFTTPPIYATLAHPRQPGVPWYMAGGATLACLLLVGIPARRRSWRSMAGMLALLAALSSGVLSCFGGWTNPGGNNSGTGTTLINPGTTHGSYTITISGDSGSYMTTSTITVTVQ